MSEMISEPIIAICRESKRFARFDGFSLIKAYRGYESEEDAIKEARDWFKARTEVEPKITYPRIIKMVASK